MDEPLDDGLSVLRSETEVSSWAPSNVDLVRDGGESLAGWPNCTTISIQCVLSSPL